MHINQPYDQHPAMSSRLLAPLLGGVFWLAMVLMSPSAWAQISPEDLLPVEEAFSLEATREADEIRLVWTIAPGYYLYRHAFKVSSASMVLGEPQLPRGKVTSDEFFGETETYRQSVEMRLPLIENTGGPIELQVTSQGCADLGVCYPPHRQSLSLEAKVPASTEALWPNQLNTDSASLSALGLVDAGALPATEAFGVEAIATGPSEVLVRFRSASEYYVYRDSLGFSWASDQARVVGFEAPSGVVVTDEYFGQTEVYFGEVEIPVAISRAQPIAQTLNFLIEFQGCLKDGICYPPMTRQIEVALPEARGQALPPSLRASGGVAVAEQDRLAQALSDTPVVALGLFLLAGVLLAFTPCVFPMVPILSGLIAGEGDQINTARAFRLSLVYVLSMALVYTAFGVVAGVFGQNLQAIFQHPGVLSAFAALFVALSLAMFGFYELQLPSALQTRLNEWSNRAEGGTLWGAAIMGALSALVVGPCVAPALMGALIYIGQTGDSVLGGAALFSMALGMGIPLMIWGTSAGRWLPKAGAWMNTIKAIFGVGLLALAIWMMERVLPPNVVMMLWGTLAIGCAVFLGALARLAANAGRWQKLGQVLGIVLLIAGSVQWLGAISGGQDWQRPLSHWSILGGTPMTERAKPAFESKGTLAALVEAIDDAPGPVFLDFYADWCVDCVRMERRTFVDATVGARLADFHLLKVDVTDYNDEHKAILAHFGLIGPPAMLFFSNGEELTGSRRFGFMSPKDFVAHLDAVTAQANVANQAP